MPRIRQPSFAGGEVSPALRNRPDFPRYAHSLARCRNFLITPQGAALNRPGTKYLAATKASGAVRLIPFILSDDDTYILEFGNLYVRFFKNGSQVMSGPSPYEVVTTYTTAQLAELKTAQVGDLILIAHSAHTLAELARTSDTSWALTDVDHQLPTMYSGGDLPTIDNTTLPTASATSPAREWTWKVTTVAQNKTTGEIFESLPHTVIEQSNTTPVPAEIAVYSDKAVTIEWPLTMGLISQPAGWSDAAILRFRIYRGRGELFGFVGETSMRSFVDVGETPDYLRQPPAGRDPFKVYELDDGEETPPTYVPVRTEEPNCLAFFEGRLLLAGTVERGGWLWGSRTNDFYNFDNPTPAADDSSFEFELASLRREQARSIVGLERAFVFTSGGVWSVAGAGGPLTRTNIQAIRHTNEGASWLSPLEIGDCLLYVRSKGVGLNELAYEQQRNKFLTVDLGDFASHLLEGYTITDWAYAQDPHRIIWAVRSDGKLLSLTYHRAQEVLAWAWHDTDGAVESVCVVPEGEEDAVYIVVNRTIDGSTVRYVERMYSRFVEDDWAGAATEPVFLDCAKTYSGAPATTMSGLEHLEGETVTVVADGQVMGPFTVASGAIDLGLPSGDTVSVIHAGLLYTPELETLDLAAEKTEIRGKKKVVSEVFFDVVASRGLKVGPDLDNLVEWKQRRVSDSYGVPEVFTGLVAVKVPGGWNTGGRAALRQALPLPLAVHGLLREFESE